MASRAAREEQIGRRSDGKPPSPPQPGPGATDQVNLTDPRVTDHEDGGRHRVGLQRPGGGRHRQPPDCCGGCQRYRQRQAADRSGPGASGSGRPAVGRPGAVLADTGCHSAANPALCEDHDLAPFGAEGREVQNQPLATRLVKPPGLPADADAVARAALYLQ